MGRLGTIVSQELLGAGSPFVTIDTDEARIRDAEQRGCLVIHGDAAEEQVLDRAGIRRASAIASVLSDDATNVFVTVTARAMNPEVTIIARGENPRTEKKLLGCGADKVVLPTAIGGKKLAQLIIRPSAENLVQQIRDQSNMIDDLARLGLQFDELAVSDDSSITGHEIGEIEIRSNHGFLIVGIRRADGSVAMNPPPTTMLASGDVVIVLGHGDDIPELARRFSAKKRTITYRGATLEQLP